MHWKRLKGFIINDIKNMKILSLLMIFFSTSIYSQDALNEKYFTKLIYTISKTTDIKEYKLIEKRYYNNQIKEQRLLVKYKSDSIDRYWRTGKYFSYYRNGNLKIADNIDLDKRIRIDTAFNYRKNGKLRFILIWEQGSKIEPLIMGPWLPGNFWSIDPARYKKIKYDKKGNKICQEERRFFNGRYVYDGELIFYNKNTGLIDAKYYYAEGKKTK